MGKGIQSQKPPLGRLEEKTGRNRGRLGEGVVVAFPYRWRRKEVREKKRRKGKKIESLTAEKRGKKQNETKAEATIGPFGRENQISGGEEAKKKLLKL